MFKWIFFGILTLPLGCLAPVSHDNLINTCMYCKSPFDHKFEVGDCAKFNPDLLESWQSSEGLPFKIVEVGKRKYRVHLKHPKFQEVTELFFKFNQFDEEYIKMECR